MQQRGRVPTTTAKRVPAAATRTFTKECKVLGATYRPSRSLNHTATSRSAPYDITRGSVRGEAPVWSEAVLERESKMFRCVVSMVHGSRAPLSFSNRPPISGSECALGRYPCLLVSITCQAFSHFHGDNTGSNPVGDANRINKLAVFQ